MLFFSGITSSPVCTATATAMELEKPKPIGVLGNQVFKVCMPKILVLHSQVLCLDHNFHSLEMVCKAIKNNLQPPLPHLIKKLHSSRLCTTIPPHPHGNMTRATPPPPPGTNQRTYDITHTKTCTKQGYVTKQRMGIKPICCQVFPSTEKLRLPIFLVGILNLEKPNMLTGMGLPVAGIGQHIWLGAWQQVAGA